ncbi:MAG: hypothetical protein OSJ67_07245 [Clostridia bacterium]|nr:hypothetical protein [Clostridia bacterium]
MREFNEQIYPTCKYCGQVTMTDREFISKAEADEYATLHCNCNEAFEYQVEYEKKKRREESLKELKSNIDELAEYAQKKGLEIDDNTCALIYDCGTAVIDGHVGSTNISFGRMSVKIAPSKKGIKFATSYTESMKKEV